ncbi:MAG: alpha-hydroxy-acid oxidizing enzyme [Sphingomonas bacterium]|nr:alpha-hydroxy acid oxidase [Sphingomonas bacterium]MDB5688145.1 alpha-hydroxy-acid oxidizing enzyme [Sphingomonas bacterium]
MQQPPERTFGAYNIADLRTRARSRLPRGIYDYVERGAEDEIGLAANRAAASLPKLLPRIGRDVSRIDTRTTLFGHEIAMPMAIAPTGGAGLVWHDGDVAIARAAAAAGIPFTASSAATMNIEEIAAAGGRQWFQLYLWADRALSHAAIDRAWAAGCEVLMVTVDIAVPPNREYNLRNGFGTPFRIGRRNAIDILSHPRWLAGVMGRYAVGGGMPRQANLPGGLRSAVTAPAPIGAAFKGDNLTWEEIAELRSRWKGIFVLKGVLRTEDAARAIDLGADGVVVSNHGGRSLDGALPSFAALPRIADAIGHRATVLVDGGVMRGEQVVRALALGAKAALVGRAPLYGLAIGGEAGVIRALALLAQEFRRTMALAGCRNVAEIDGGLLAEAGL